MANITEQKIHFLWLLLIIETDVFFFFQIHFTRADCVGNETNLFSCNVQLHKDQCTHGEDAGVRCNAPLVKKLQVRILCFFSFISYCYIFWSIFIFFYLTIVL